MFISPHLAVLHVRVVHAVSEEDPPELGDPVGVGRVVVPVAGERAEEVQLDLLGGRGQVAPGWAVVGEQLLVVVRLLLLLPLGGGGRRAHQLVVHDRLPNRALLFDREN